VIAWKTDVQLMMMMTFIACIFSLIVYIAYLSRCRKAERSASAVRLNEPDGNHANHPTGVRSYASSDIYNEIYDNAPTELPHAAAIQQNGHFDVLPDRAVNPDLNSEPARYLELINVPENDTSSYNSPSSSSSSSV